MILYFANRGMEILGQASTSLPKGLRIVDDLKSEDIETGVAVFDCKIAFGANTRADVEACAEVGNYILRSHDGENEFYTIIESELDTDAQEVYVYAEDAGLDLLNEITGAYAADKAYPIEHYINKFAAGSGFEIGINEAEDLTRKLSWDGEATATERLASVATQFGGCEISYSFEINSLQVEKMYINIYKERGKDIGAQLRLNQHVDRIVTSKSIANVGTALECIGGTPEKSEKPITLSGYTYDDGDFYVSGTRLYSRNALNKWARPWGGHIVKQFSYDTTSKQELCNRAITELKKISEMEVNYEADILKFPDNVKIGDRVNIIDAAGELYLSTRLLQLETSVVNQEKKATLGEFLLKKSGISQKVADLAEQFAKVAQTSTRAYVLAENAEAMAETAQTQANLAVEEAGTANTAANEAKSAAANATASAQAATTAAETAQTAVAEVEGAVAGLETSVANAHAAAEQAQQAAATAETKATEAQTAAVNAQTKANEAAESATTAQNKADTAESKADTAKSTAEQAITEAEAASTTAAAAKLDAENAQKEIDELGEGLTTLSNTMTADFARKTDLTETTASLQTQITQNAAGISSTATKVQEIDETANNAAEQAQQAQTTATAAQTQAAQAKADAENAQTAASNAAAAAEQAQSEANTAKSAAETAKSVADKAKADLEAAEADLATVTGRVDATEEEIQAAQEAVIAAQNAANKAQEDAEAAEEKATTAQNTASTAVSNAAAAKTAADNARDAATAAQAAADKAQGDATAAQNKANEAATAAVAAQSTANTAKDNAASAQTKANEAATAAANAKTAADNAEAKANKAAQDLATAEQNLATVAGRMDATEEEVEAAKAAVVTAQQAADKAKADAATAQSQADKAKADAATAAQAAATAKAAADQAQADAEAAQEAADKAQDDVNALAVRVTTAETSITQNAEEIALRATKTEVTETLGGYYTKSEADAKISTKADEISLSVSNTYATKTALAETDSKATAAQGAADEANTKGDEIYDVIAEQNSELITQAQGIFLESLKSYTQTNAAATISSVVIRYMASASNSGITIDTEEWSESIPALSSTTKYLWAYEEVTYSNENVEKQTPAIIATYSSSAVSSVTHYYTASDSNKTEDVAAASWVTTIPEEISLNKMYLWHYTSVTFANGTKQESEKAIIGRYVPSFNELTEMVSTQFSVLANSINMNVTAMTEAINGVNTDLQSKFNTITKYFTFDINGLEIGSATEDANGNVTKSPYKVVIDNDRYSMIAYDKEVMWIANGEVYAPEMTVDNRFNFFGFQITQDAASGTVDCEYVGGE